MIYVVAKNYVKEGCLDEFLAVARVLVEETNKNDAGCVSYGMYQDTQNPLVVTVLEQWESQEALDNHMKAKHFLDAIPKLHQLCDRPGDVSLYTKLF
ncbi:MAG TPA: antibiotic biosynthesis monooxygenase [Papillibacter sp.]|jgi:quinol monooxygenase YgiN|nr:antibiotic biosynthesis monooxygenase [Papillibacter sp.]